MAPVRIQSFIIPYLGKYLPTLTRKLSGLKVLTHYGDIGLILHEFVGRCLIYLLYKDASIENLYICAIDRETVTLLLSPRGKDDTASLLVPKTPNP